MGERFRFVAAALAPLVLTPLLFVVTLRGPSPPAPLARGALPQEAYAADRCTWYCHNHGCPHRPVLGTVLAGDRGLYGRTIHALRAAGDTVSPAARGVGYGAVNLAVFCGVWPAGMYALWIVALRQRWRLRTLRTWTRVHTLARERTRTWTRVRT
jgi:hypothetical protein